MTQSPQLGFHCGVRVLLDPHDLSDLSGQQWLKMLITECDPKEAA